MTPSPHPTCLCLQGVRFWAISSVSVTPSPLPPHGKMFVSQSLVPKVSFGSVHFFFLSNCFKIPLSSCCDRSLLPTKYDTGCCYASQVIHRSPLIWGKSYACSLRAPGDQSGKRWRVHARSPTAFWTHFWWFPVTGSLETSRQCSVWVWFSWYSPCGCIFIFF